MGAKLAERLVLELKDRTGPLAALASGGGAGTGRSSAVPASVAADAVAALEALGFGAREARGRVEAAIEKLLDRAGARAKDGSGPTVEDIIQAALRTRP